MKKLKNFQFLSKKSKKIEKIFNFFEKKLKNFQFFWKNFKNFTKIIKFPSFFPSWADFSEASLSTPKIVVLEAKNGSKNASGGLKNGLRRARGTPKRGGEKDALG